jgi:tetratricopeptide (TPR) repeat protein
VLFFALLLLAYPAAAKTSLLEANQLLAHQQYEQAAKAFEGLGAQSSKKIEGWRLNNWGLCLIRLDKAGQAVSILEQALAADGKNFTARANLGAAYEKIGDKVKAMDVYRRALELLRQENSALASGKAAKDPVAVENDPSSRTATAGVFVEAPSRLKEAQLKEALKAAADFLQAEKFQEAANTYAGIGMCGGAKREGWKLNNWGLALIRLGNFKEALPRLKKSVELYPDNPKAWNNLGVVYENLGATQEAKDAYAQATGPGAKGEVDAVKAELNQLKLDFNSEKKKWEASK